jgi:hypothetical protein
MPINTCQQYLKSVLNGLILPLGLGVIEAFITPPNPNIQAGANVCSAYIWGSHGDEKRKALPRATHGNLGSGGLKEILHNIDVWLIWFGYNIDEDSDADNQFPSILDFVLGQLRNARLVDAANEARDPVTGQTSQLLAVGENMSYVYTPVRAIVDQRTFRFDAQITCDVVEEIRA